MRTRPKVKICGTTTAEDARMAQEAGADLLGILVDVPFSSRSRSLDEALAIADAVTMPWVAVTYGLTVTELIALDRTGSPYAIQVMDDSPPGRFSVLSRFIRSQLWKSIFLPPMNSSGEPPQDHPPEDIERLIREYAEAGVDAVLIDTVVQGKRGGTGKVNDWSVCETLARKSPIPLFLSGGISPENVADAIRQVCPSGIDLCSGVESEPGKRDRDKLHHLMAEIASLF